MARRRKLIFGLAALAALLSVIILNHTRSEAISPSDESDDLFLQLLSEPVEGFAPVNSERALHFPEDHTAHPQQRTEAWVLSGILNDADSNSWAVQIVILRVGLSAEPDHRESQWAATDAYAGVVTMTDAHSTGLDIEMKSSRGAAGLAGTRLEPLQIWIEDWQLDLDKSDQEFLSLNIKLSTVSTDLGLELSGKVPLVRSGGQERLLSEIEAPFVLYLQPRMEASGTIRQRGRTSDVTGRFVLEHAWGELPPPGGPIARDRFTLFLNDGREIMLIRTHRVDGSGMPETAGVLIAADGTPQELSADALSLRPEKYLEHVNEGARYPTHWLLEIPEEHIRSRLVPDRVDHAGVAWRPLWLAPVHLKSGNGGTSGSGVVLLNGYEDASRQ